VSQQRDPRDLHGGEAHPTPEELIGYVDGTLSAVREDAVQEHLSLCADCAELVLDLPLLRRGEPEAAQVGEGPSPPGLLDPPPVPAVRAERRRWRFRFGLAAAAGWVVAAASFALWIGKPGPWVPFSPEETGAAFEVVDGGWAELEDVSRRRSGEVVRVAVPPGAERVGLVLRLPRDASVAPGQRLTLRIQSADGREVLRRQPVAVDPYGQLVLVLRTKGPAPTRYRVEAWREGGETRASPTATFELWLVPSD
jgi:anti-sigma factor RsiW